MKLSVVITTFNSEDKIEDCLKSVNKVASEIIVVDSSGNNKTELIAKKYTDKIFKRENYLMLNKNKNFGFNQAVNKWVLSLDADERLDDDLVEEILALESDIQISGFYIPRKNIIFKKWIKNSGWYPDYQLRLFKKDKGKFDELHIHEMLNINGETANLKGHIYHLNYDSISHFLEKTINVYTVSEAKSKINEGYRFDKSDLYKMPVSEFMRRYFSNKGYLDGMHGLVLSLLMSFYHFVIFLRIWEMNKYKEEDGYEIFKDGVKYSKKEVGYWQTDFEMRKQKSILGKSIVKLKSKIRV